MDRRWLCVCCIILLVEFSGAGWAQDLPISSFIPGEILVKFKTDVREDQIRKFQSSVGVIQKTRSVLTGVRRLKLPQGLSVEDAIRGFRNNSDVEYAEPNYTRRAFATPFDPDFDQQWGLNNVGQSLAGTSPILSGSSDADIDALEAWDMVQGSQNFVVAVIDSGVDYTHPDLTANIWSNLNDPWTDPQDPSTGNGIDDDANGKTDDYHGWNFVGNQVCSIDPQGQCNCTPDDPIGNNDPMDDYGHGTPVAGIIAARSNNGVGVAGILWTAQIMALKALDGVGCGSVGDEVQAMDYAVQNGARIITTSFGAAQYSQTEYDAIAGANNAGILVVAPAGNNSSNNDSTPVYPAGYDLPNLISVAASDFDDNLAAFSNYGKSSVDLAAPGDCIYSTMPTGPFGLQNPPNFNVECTDAAFQQDYDYNTGTSFAAAFVAGVAGLLRVQDPGLSPPELRAILIATSDAKNTLKGKVTSFGRLNADRALTRNLDSSFSGGKQGQVGCGGIDFVGGNGPVSPGTAVAAILVMLFPLAMVSRRLRKVLLNHRRSIFFFVCTAQLIICLGMAPTAYAQGTESPQMTHQLALKIGFHLYRSSDYFNSTSEFYDQNDLTSLSEELEYDFLFFPPTTLSLAVGQYIGETDFNSICCSKVKFTNRYIMSTFKYHFTPSKLKPFEFYLGPGLGYNHLKRTITVTGSTENFSQGVFDIHLVGGVQVRFNTRLSLLLESRYSYAKIKDANDLGDTLNIGGITTYLGVAWQFPDFRHIIPTAPATAEEGVTKGPPQVTEERVIPPVEKPPVEVPEEKTPVQVPTMAEMELEPVHFEFDDWIITEEARAILERNARWLQSHSDVDVVLEGHCDQRGTNEYNLALGGRRAEAVKRVLVTLGVSEKRLSVISYGEERPLCFEATEECFAKNRRVQFTIR